MTDHEKNNYCNYDASLALKGIGFKDECHAFFKEKAKNVFHFETINKLSCNNKSFKIVANNHVAAPTFLDAIDYLWKCYQIDVNVNVSGYGNSFDWQVNNFAPTFVDESVESGSKALRYEAYNTAIINACEYIKSNNGQTSKPLKD